MNRPNTAKSLPRLVRILTIEPFVITALWTTAEIHRIDFAPLFEQWKKENDLRLFPLFNYETFKQVAISPERTLNWPTVLVQVKLPRRTIEGPLDLDPDELYRQSELIQEAKKLTVGTMLREAREAAGLSQTEVATKVAQPEIIFLELKTAGQTFN